MVQRCKRALESWAASWRARAEAVLEEERRARRARTIKLGAVPPSASLPPRP
jgi:hypothetical protein